MQFIVISRDEPLPQSGTLVCYLRTDRWDDWAKFRTQFQAYYFDAQSELHDLGDVKIGHVGLKGGSVVGPGVRAPSLEPRFQSLPEGYFSLGQQEHYYETLAELAPSERSAILSGLRDLSADLQRFDAVLHEPVVFDSLLRFITPETVRTRFHRLVTGDASLTRYSFAYHLPPSGNQLAENAVATFDVIPHAMPPTNVHVIIGRNGVGKTRLMHGLARSLLGYTEDGDEEPIGTLRFADQAISVDVEPGFAGLVSLSFSAFDNHELPESRVRLKATSVGLRFFDKELGASVTRNPEQLAEAFVESFESCRRGLRRERWARAVTQLYNDPVFSDANPLSLLDFAEEAWSAAAKRYFEKKLSSGHKIVLLSITKLVELVDERTLVLLDEPEGHLHPPLLAAYIRSVSELLTSRNGVAIVATHSPVVLQEVPAACVSILERSGRVSSVSRPLLQTFGENVGRLSREVFGLEVTHSGFHRRLREEAAASDTFEELLQRFGGEIGAEGAAIARGMILRKQRAADENA